MQSKTDKKQEIIRTLFFSVTALNASGIFLFWFTNNWQSAVTASAQIISAGGLLGLLLALSVLHQFILQGRLPIIERYIGTVLVQRIHRYNAYLIFFLVLLHPLLVTIGHSRLHENGFIRQFVDQVQFYPYVWLALIASMLLIFVIAMSINIVRRRLRYEYWYTVHLSVYIAVLIAFFHQIENGQDLLTSDAFRTYWIALYIVVLGTVAWFRFGRIIWQFWNYNFTVAKVVKEAEGVISIYIASKKPLPDNFFKPGQFGIWRFFNKKLWWQAHPFTISTGNPKNGLRLTPKAVGDYTTDLQKIKPGTKLFFDGPHGVFTTDRLEDAKPLFIAGGIGITPIRAMLEGLGERAKDAIVIYSVRGMKDLALGKELEDISKKYGAKLHCIFSEKAPKGGRKGIVNKDVLSELVDDVGERKIALCGPPGMMDAVGQALIELGVPKQHIYTERFAFTAK
ncbi:MAG TPA: ferredoxin reductase family protein [Candidatus Saccharimonadales bacterium]|nr:ferredoxin reductase family protein [Candidatus Saccharimonadales bacterium]